MSEDSDHRQVGRRRKQLLMNKSIKMIRTTHVSQKTLSNLMCALQDDEYYTLLNGQNEQLSFGLPEARLGIRVELAHRSCLSR